MTSLLDNPMRESLQAGRMAGSAAQASLAQLLARSALGPVLLCLRAGTGHACALLAQDAAISACSEVRACGPREWLLLESLRGRPLARVYLLPDSDFCEWDALCALLPQRTGARPATLAMAGPALCVHQQIGRGLCIWPQQRLSSAGRALCRALAREEACLLHD